VEVIEDPEQLVEQVDHLGVLQVPPVGNQLRQRGAFDEFHHQERGVGALPPGPERSVNGRNAGMPQVAQHGGFPLEQLVGLEVGGSPRMQHLERDLPAQANVAGQQSVGEAPAAKRANHFVAIGDQDGIRHPLNMVRVCNRRESGQPRC
jgi:hypothetical protein